MATTAKWGNIQDLHDATTGEPIAYRKENPPYGHTPLPAHRAFVRALQAEPTMQVIQVPAPCAGKTGGTHAKMEIAHL